MNTLYLKQGGHWDESLGDYVKTPGGVGYVMPTGAVATSEYDASYLPIFAVDPATSLTGSGANDQWITLSGIETNQKFNVAYNKGRLLKRLIINNGHSSGALTDRGAKDIILYGTNVEAAYMNTIYANFDDLTELHSFQLRKHVAADVADPQEIALPTITQEYKYYVFRIANSWGGIQIRLRQVDMYFEKLPWKESQENYIKIKNCWMNSITSMCGFDYHLDPASPTDTIIVNPGSCFDTTGTEELHLAAPVTLQIPEAVAPTPKAYFATIFMTDQGIKYVINSEDPAPLGISHYRTIGFVKTDYNANQLATFTFNKSASMMELTDVSDGHLISIHSSGYVSHDLSPKWSIGISKSYQLYHKVSVGSAITGYWSYDGITEKGHAATDSQTTHNAWNQYLNPVKPALFGKSSVAARYYYLYAKQIYLKRDELI